MMLSLMGHVTSCRTRPSAGFNIEFHFGPRSEIFHSKDDSSIGDENERSIEDETGTGDSDGEFVEGGDVLNTSPALGP